MVGIGSRLENQPRVSGHTSFDMAVDALGLHDGAGDAVEEKVQGRFRSRFHPEGTAWVQRNRRIRTAVDQDGTH